MTLNDIIRLFELNKDNLDEACKIDDSEFKFSFNKAISILNRFKEFNSGFADKKCIAVTNGNPYITLILCMQALSQNIRLTINVQDTMIALNGAIVKIFSSNFRDDAPTLKEYMSPREFIGSDADDIVVIDDKTKFNYLKDELGIKVRYMSLLNVELYTNSEDMSSLTDTISEYCNQSFINLDIHKDESIDEFVKQTNKYEGGNVALILDKDPVYQADIYDKLDGKQVYVNCNPFAKIEADVALKNLLK